MVEAATLGVWVILIALLLPFAREAAGSHPLHSRLPAWWLGCAAPGTVLVLSTFVVTSLYFGLAADGAPGWAALLTLTVGALALLAAPVVLGLSGSLARRRAQPDWIPWATTALVAAEGTTWATIGVVHL